MDEFCTNCGTKLNPDASFCTGCGKQVKDFVPHLSSIHDQPSGKKVPGPKKTRYRRVWIPITAIVTALALVVTLTFALRRWPQGKSIGDYDVQIFMPEQAIFSEKAVIVEDTMTPTGGMIQSGDGKVKMAFDELCIDEPLEAKIVQLEVENPPDDSILNVYDFSIDSKKDISGVVTIEVPYDPTQIPPGRSAEECVSGVYYNQELHEWIEETYTIDQIRNTVIIKTTHLSPHGARIRWNDSEKHWNDLFINLSQGTPYEYVVPRDSEQALKGLTQEEMIKVLEEIKKTGSGQPQKALNDAALAIMGATGSFSDIGVKTFRLTSYAGKWSKVLEDRLGNLSGALVLVQLASDVYHETPQAQTYFNLLKGLTFWQGAAVATSLGGPLGGAVATVVLAGMFLYEFFWEPIDIPQYIEESNHRIIVDAYNLYYHSGENYRSKTDWMKRIDSIVDKASSDVKSGGNFEDRFKRLLDEEITAYATEFFNEKPSKIRKYVEESFDIKQGYIGSYDRVYSKSDRKRNEKYVKEYVTEILSGQYDGMTTSLEDELVHTLKGEIYRSTIPATMKMRKEYQYLKQLEGFRRQQKEICQYFNTKISLSIRDRGCEYGEESEFAGFYIEPKILERDPEYKREKWIIQLNSRGQGQMNFNLIAHQMAGDFTQLNLYHKDHLDKVLSGTAEPVKVLEIGTIASQEHEILFGEEAVDITISAERDSGHEEDSSGKVNYLFEAVSDYEGKCSIKWNFGDESEEVQTKGNKSSLQHEYEGENGDIFTITAQLLDKDDILLAKDTTTITIDNEEGDLTGNWQGTFQITDDGGLVDYVKKVAQQIGELFAKGIMKVISGAFGFEMPSDEEISQAVTDSIVVNEELFQPFQMAVNLSRIDEEHYNASIVTVTEEENYYETIAKHKNNKLYFTLVHEDGSKAEFILSLQDKNVLSGEFEIKLGFLKSLKGETNLYR